MRVLLVCSPGGHLQQMLALRPAWDGFDRAWATLPSADVSYLLSGEKVTLAHGPTNRSAKNAVRNLVVAWRLIRSHRPDAILSTGAGIAVPFFLVGKLLRVRLVYVESVTRTESISLSGRLLYPLASRFFTQWPESARDLRRAEYAGAVL
jgi:UDP-N-acetylglucosamine:LPS N-acetylglucosamine transferase